MIVYDIRYSLTTYGDQKMNTLKQRMYTSRITSANIAIDHWSKLSRQAIKDFGGNDDLGIYYTNKLGEAKIALVNLEFEAA
jgi:hypothetical protein